MKLTPDLCHQKVVAWHFNLPLSFHEEIKRIADERQVSDLPKINWDLVVQRLLEEFIEENKL